MRSLAYFFLAAIILQATVACGPSAGNGDDDDDDDCPNRCTSFGWEECLAPGNWAEPVMCTEDQICTEDLGCKDCYPGSRYCASETEVYLCNDDGTGGTPAETCEGEDVCSNGVCKTACDRALDLPSNVGCDFWAVDLDNEAVTTFGITNDAAAQQYSVAIANNNNTPVDVRVYRNAGRVGDPLNEQMVTMVTVPAHDLVQVNLPQREVDGTMGQNGTYVKGSGSHTFVSPHAYHIKSTGPVTAYQFNPIVQQYSNDASVLIPIQTLRNHYYVLGWPTSNPCGPSEGMFAFDSIPDHTSVTIIGIEPDTVVTFNPTHPVAPSGGDSGFAIPATEAGTPIQFTVNPYDVVNLESAQPEVDITQCLSHLDQDGDFTGSTVTSNKPIAVFVANERGNGTGGADPPPPPGWDEETCCTEHMEEQMMPTVALGWRFALSRSPVRSSGGYEEPDLYRVLATEDGTVINTSLAAPNNTFTLDAGEHRTFHAYAGFTLESTGGAIMVGQFLVSQGLTVDGIGDPSFLIFPAAEQHRTEYVFLVPTTWQDNYMVLAMPSGASVFIDGEPLGEFSTCTMAPIGPLNNLQYVQLTCPLAEGVHTVSSNQPVGLSVYGYYSVGAYSYAGGSNVDIINPVE
jgi:hypothetical protein